MQLSLTAFADNVITQSPTPLAITELALQIFVATSIFSVVLYCKTSPQSNSSPIILFSSEVL